MFKKMSGRFAGILLIGGMLALGLPNPANAWNTVPDTTICKTVAVGALSAGATVSLKAGPVSVAPATTPVALVNANVTICITAAVDKVADVSIHLSEVGLCDHITADVTANVNAIVAVSVTISGQVSLTDPVSVTVFAAKDIAVPVTLGVDTGLIALDICDP